MGHYDCRKCGAYLCLGDCDEATMEELEAELHKTRVAHAKQVLATEDLRWMQIQEALEILDKEGTPYTYKGKVYNEDSV